MALADCSRLAIGTLRVAIKAVIFVVAVARVVGGTQGLLAEVDPEGGAQTVDDPFAVAFLDLRRREVGRVAGRTRGVLARRQDEVQEFGLRTVVVELAFSADVVDGNLGTTVMVEGVANFIERCCLRVDQ